MCINNVREHGAYVEVAWAMYAWALITLMHCPAPCTPSPRSLSSCGVRLGLLVPSNEASLFRAERVSVMVRRHIPVDVRKPSKSFVGSFRAGRTLFAILFTVGTQEFCIPTERAVVSGVPPDCCADLILETTSEPCMIKPCR